MGPIECQIGFPGSIPHSMPLILVQGQEEELVQFLRFQQTALDSEELADIIFIVAKDKVEAAQLLQLARDMLFRLSRFDLLVRRLLQDNLVAEALKVARHCKNFSLIADPVEAIPLDMIVNAIVSKVNQLPERQVSQRAAYLYLLYDFLKEWDPSLFPGPKPGSPTRREPVANKLDEGPTTPASPKQDDKSFSPGGFVTQIPEYPFGTFPDAVGQTLAALFGYKTK